MFNNSELKSLVYLYIFGKGNKDKENFNRYKNKDDYKDKRFVKNMYDGMKYYLDFLNDPIGYCSKDMLTVYCNQQYVNNVVFHVVHKIDNKRFLIIHINFEECSSGYLIKYEINDIIKNERKENQELIKRIFLENNDFFENELINIKGLFKNKKIVPDDIK